MMSFPGEWAEKNMKNIYIFKRSSLQVVQCADLKKIFVYLKTPGF